MGIKTHKAFTIIELLVAMALVVILVALSSVIFAVAVRAHRMADSTLEISRRAEVIAEQLLSDVRGLRKDAPLAIWLNAMRRQAGITIRFCFCQRQFSDYPSV